MATDGERLEGAGESRGADTVIDYVGAAAVSEAQHLGDEIFPAVDDHASTAGGERRLGLLVA